MHHKSVIQCSNINGSRLQNIKIKKTWTRRKPVESSFSIHKMLTFEGLRSSISEHRAGKKKLNYSLKMAMGLWTRFAQQGWSSC
jgi:hypothetical protein